MPELPDELLPLSRRLDWRFLLPDPSLNRVYYSGPGDALLFRALRRFSAEAVYTSGSHADLAVMINPPLRDFVQALPTVRSFYIELNRPGWADRALHVSSPGRYLRAARVRGFCAQAYWHYPDFDTATRIIPLFETRPLAHVMVKDVPDLKARIRTAAASFLLKTGLLARAIACLSIVGYAL